MENGERCGKKKVRARKRNKIWERAFDKESIKRGECVEAPKGLRPPHVVTTYRK